MRKVCRIEVIRRRTIRPNSVEILRTRRVQIDDIRLRLGRRVFRSSRHVRQILNHLARAIAEAPSADGSDKDRCSACCTYFVDERNQVGGEVGHGDVLLGLLIVVPKLDGYVGVVLWRSGFRGRENVSPVAACAEGDGCCAVVAEVLARCAVLERRVEEAIAPAWTRLVVLRMRTVKSVPPPPADCTAVVESPARKKAGGFAFGAATAVDVKVAMVASKESAEKCILTE
jgi:hypothetical protein